MLARELSRPLSVLIANQPTRGVDVGAIEFLHSRLVAERDRGTAVLIVSTELDEVVALADRIAVMYRGRIVGIVPPDTSREVLGLMMAGVPTDEAIGQRVGHHPERGGRRLRRLPLEADGRGEREPEPIRKIRPRDGQPGPVGPSPGRT